VGECQGCIGTGVVLTMRSWFPVDGCDRHRCTFCGGSGRSSHQDPEGAAIQKRLRALAPTRPRAGEGEKP
jgi:hypothetical protein